MEPVKYQRKTRQRKDPPQPKDPQVEQPKAEENKYAPKDRVGAKKKVSAPGAKVTRVGLGNLTVEHTNPTSYNPH